MSLRKSVLIAFVIIPGCVTLFTALKSAGFAPGTSGKAAGFAVLSVDAAYSDRAVGEALSGAGIPGYISESNSWVFLDDFGELKRVALDLYDEMVEPFDPRNDGYAERLRSFFVKDGKRRFFIDLGSLWRQPQPDAFRSGTKALPGATLTYGQLEGRISAALGGETAFTLDGFSATRDGSGLWLLLLSLAASGGALFLALKTPGAFPRGFSRLTAALIPAQGALALSGPGGFACAAALFGCFECLLPPIRENLLRVQRYRRRFRFDRIFRINWLLALFFFLVYVLAAAASPVDPLTAVLAGISAFTAFGLFLRLESSESNPEGGHIHRRFLPIPIRAPSFSLNSFPRITLPFALASFFSLFLPLFGASGRSQDIFPAALSRRDSPLAAMPDIPAREEYEAHFAFQASFSLRPLGSQDRTGDAAYLAYYLGEDGLIAGSLAGLPGDSRETANPAAPDYPEIPPFPLEELSAFLENGRNYTARGTGAGDIFAALVILFLALPSCFRRVRKKRKMGSFLIFNDKGDKQAAA
jgi:hypothetical protein